MYSWEIQDLIEMRNALLEYQEYLNVVKTSPQIDYTEYLPNEDCLHLTTDDKYDFKFKVKSISESKKTNY